MVLHIVHPNEERHEMTRDDEGYWSISLANISPGTRYYFRPNDEKDFPDPASRFQPEGVHGPSEVVDLRWRWNDADWKGIDPQFWIIYELHVGTFTPEGTFEAIIPRLDDLAETGINAIEIMPIAQFPGARNWGYDGVFPYAVQNSYGGPMGLKRLVDACHQKGIAVILDVVYNHQGPEGNYMSAFAPYFSSRYHTPWGDAINFDWEWSDGVREFYIQNTLYWLDEFHFDGLRFDAIHAVFDSSPVHFWDALHHEVRELESRTGRRYQLIAESDLNDPRVIEPAEVRGFGFDMQWLDDFHHALYKLLFKNDAERYCDFGSIHQLARAYKEGFVHCGKEWVKFRKRRYGASSENIPGNRFIVFNSNHDQIGNRPDGARPSSLLDIERQKLAAAAMYLSPYIPMLFMGEEYSDDRPFHYFVSHSDSDLLEAIRKGRKEEFKDVGFSTEPPDAQDEQTFRDSVLDWDKRNEGYHRLMLDWHRKLIRMRKELEPLRNFLKEDIDTIVCDEEAMILTRRSGDEILVCFFNFSQNGISCRPPSYIGEATLILESTGGNEEKYTPTITAEQSVSVPPLSVGVYRSRRGKNIESLRSDQ